MPRKDEGLAGKIRPQINKMLASGTKFTLVEIIARLQDFVAEYGAGPVRTAVSNLLHKGKGSIYRHELADSGEPIWSLLEASDKPKQSEPIKSRYEPPPADPDDPVVTGEDKAGFARLADKFSKTVESCGGEAPPVIVSAELVHCIQGELSALDNLLERALAPDPEPVRVDSVFDIMAALQGLSKRLEGCLGEGQIVRSLKDAERALAELVTRGLVVEDERPASPV
jgi:hypothetical protein